MRMSLEIKYPPSMGSLRTLSIHELCSLPKGTLVWIDRLGLNEFLGKASRNMLFSASIQSYSYDQNRIRKVHNLPTDNDPIPYNSFSFITRVEYYRLYISNHTHSFDMSWDDIHNRGIYLIEQDYLNNFLSPFMPLLDCFSAALHINKDLKVIP